MNPYVAGGAAVLSYVGGQSSARAQGKSNRDNMWIYKDSRNLAQTNRATAYQNATQDMKKAGINPMLAYMQGGSSAAPMGSANAQQAETAEGEGIQQAVATALQTKRLKQDISNLKASEKKTQAETEVIKGNIPNQKLKATLGNSLRSALQHSQSKAGDIGESIIDSYTQQKQKFSEGKSASAYKRSKAHKDAVKARKNSSKRRNTNTNR